MYYFCNTQLLTRIPQYMKITILQTDIKWACPYDNMDAAKAMIENAPQSELYVLPEMWATGFAPTSPHEACSDTPLEWMKRMAGQHKCAICGSAAVKTGNEACYNRHYFVLPDETYFYYDKHHLFTYGGENRFYKAGNKRVIAQYKGIRFLLQTCYDLRFPAWTRNDEDYDAIIFTANWPESRNRAWQILLRARAIENQCYVIGANRIGCDPSCSYAGNSAIIAADGKTLAQAKGRKAQCVTADIDIEELQKFRTKFPVLKDRDTIKLNEPE